MDPREDELAKPEEVLAGDDKVSGEALKLLADGLPLPGLGDAGRKSLTSLGFPDVGTLLSGFSSDLLKGTIESNQNDRDKKGDEKPQTAFKSEKPTAAELELLKTVAKPEQIERLKAEINKLGQDPRDVVLAVAKDKNTRVIGLGEWHVTPNGLRTLAEIMMGDFKKNGITHLAVEMDKDDQKLLDLFAKGDKTAAKKISGKYGGLQEDSLRMMAEAARNGISLVAVDGKSKKAVEDDKTVDNKTEEDKKKTEKDEKEELQFRDEQMSKNIDRILQSDPKARVLFVVGAAHLEKHDKSEGKSAGTLLKEKGHAVVTFGAHMAAESTYFTTPEITKNISKAVAVETSKTTELKDFPATVNADGPKVGKTDFAIFFPENSALKIAEQAHGKESPKILPELESLTKVLLKRGNTAETEVLVERTLNIAKKAYGEQSKEVADLYARLARESQGEKTAQLYVKSMQIRETLDGGKPAPEYLQTAGFVVQLSISDGKIKDAARYFNRAAEHALKDKNTTKEEASTFLELSSSLAQKVLKSGDLKTYETVLQHQLELKTKFAITPVFDEHRLLANALARENPKQAEKHFEAALVAAGSSNEKLFNTRQGFAKFLEDQNRLTDAEKYRRANLELSDKNRNFFSANTDLARNLERQNKDTEAGQLYREAMKKWEQGATASTFTEGETDAAFLTSYAAFLKRTGNNEEATKVEDNGKFIQLMKSAERSYKNATNKDETLKQFEQAMVLWEKGASNKKQGELFLKVYADFLESIEKTEHAKQVRAKSK